MTSRRVHAALALVAVLLLAGCFGGPSEIPEEDLTGEASYDWETNATATFNLSRSSYTTVVEIQNRTELTVWRSDRLGTDSPVDVEALQFRFENRTVVNATHGNLSATRTGDNTVISLPAENGTVAYTAGRTGKRFSAPVFVEGSYELVLPPSTRIGVPLLSQASPGGYSTDVTDDRMTVRWPDLSDGTLTVRYYLQRDLLLFGGLAVIVIVAGGGGTVYYLYQIRILEERRKAMGDDIEYEDDIGDDGPPPGMR
jgi:hypothetical protein